MNQKNLENLKVDLLKDLMERMDKGKCFSTQIIYRLLIADTSKIGDISLSRIADIANILFPGFKKTLPSETSAYNNIVMLAYEKIIKPAIFNQHPNLMEYKSPKDTIKALGEETLIYPIKSCNSGDWQRWISKMDPKFDYAKWRDEQ